MFFGSADTGAMILSEVLFPLPGRISSCVGFLLETGNPRLLEVLEMADEGAL